MHYNQWQSNSHVYTVQQITISRLCLSTDKTMNSGLADYIPTMAHTRSWTVTSRTGHSLRTV